MADRAMPAFPRRTHFYAWFQGDRGAVAALVALFFGANWPLLAGKVSEHWDGADQFAPYFAFLARVSRSGHFLLWNPFSSGGSPDFAEPQFGAFSPVTLLFGLVGGPGALAFRLYWLSVWLLGGVGMYVLARALAAPPWGALVTGLGFVFSGYYLGHAEHLSLVYAYSFVPWIVWRVRAAMTAGRLWPACQAGALWGLSALAGNPAVVIPAILFMGVVALAWLPTGPGVSWRTRARVYAVTMLGLAAVGTVVLAPTYLSFRHEVVGFSDRGLPLPRELVLPAQSLGFRWLGSLVSPLIPLATYQSPGWPQIDICYLPVYFGAALPVLALFALWQQRTRWWVWAVAGTGLLFLGFTLGSALPLRGWLYDLVPPTRFIRHPPMFRGFFILSVAMLAASATGLIEQRRRQPEAPGSSLRSLAVVAGVCAGLSVAAFVGILATLPIDYMADTVPAAGLHLTVTWIGLALLCLTAVRWPRVRRRLPVALALLTAVDLLGAFALTGSMVFEWASPPPAAPTHPLLELGAPGFARAANAHGNRNLYDLRPAFVSYTAMTNPVRSQWEKDPLLLAKIVGPQRVWFADQAPVVAPTTANYTAFASRVHALQQMVILRHDRADLLRAPADLRPDGGLAAIAAALPAEPVGGHVRSYRANALALSITCPRAGFLLLTDRWSRSWTASVNGRRVPLDGGDFLFRLVPVVAGENLVEMKFQPPWVFPLLTLSWTVLLAVGGGSVRQVRRRRQVSPVVLKTLPGNALTGEAPASLPCIP